MLLLSGKSHTPKKWPQSSTMGSKILSSKECSKENLISPEYTIVILHAHIHTPQPLSISYNPFDYRLYLEAFIQRSRASNNAQQKRNTKRKRRDWYCLFGVQEGVRKVKRCESPFRNDHYRSIETIEMCVFQNSSLVCTGQPTLGCRPTGVIVRPPACMNNNNEKEKGRLVY